MLYYLENTELIEYRTYGHSRYKPMTDRVRTLVTYRKLIYFPITSTLQRLFMSPKTIEHIIWHQSHDVVDGVMVHFFFMVKPRNTLIVCILNFQWRQGTCILCYV
jgi:hypothetical protein